MEIDAGAHKPDGRDLAEQERERPAAAVPPRGVSSRIVLGGLVGLLLLATASFYFTDRRTGTDVATRPGTGTPSESSAAITAARPGERAEQPSRSATSTQPATPQQSAIPASPSPPPALRERPTPPPTTTARDSTISPPQARRPAAPEAAPRTDPAAAAQAPADPQSPMRDQPTALPDQATAAPKNEIILVVKRPANIRSAPGQAGRVIGTAAKDAQVKEIGRSPSGNWVQVETATGSGWMSAKLLGPLAPQSR